MGNKFLVLDIETAPIYTWETLPDRLKQIWSKKVENRFQECKTVAEKYENNAGFFSLFSQIVCISVSFSDSQNIKSYVGEEFDLLSNFATDLELISKKYQIKFVGHNILSFDLPFILQRSLIHKIAMPVINKIIGCKPWEVPAYDTMLMWKATSNEWYSIDYICECLGLASPKDEMQCNQVALEYRNGNILKIKTYCEKDVIATKQVFNILFNSLNS